MSAPSDRIKAPEPSTYSCSETALEAKVVLLGNSGTGKTSLVQCYVNDVFDDNITTTVGAGFATKRIVMDDVKIKLQIWDTAGQERFRSMTPMYYRGAAAAVLVYDITNTESFRAVKGWVKELNDVAQQQGETQSMAIGIAGNKKDLESKREVSTQDALEYADSIGAFFLETSAMRKEGLDDLFMGLCQRIVQGKVVKGPASQDKGGSESPSVKRGRTASNKTVQTKLTPRKEPTIKLEVSTDDGSRKKKKKCILF